MGFTRFWRVDGVAMSESKHFDARIKALQCSDQNTSIPGFDQLISESKQLDSKI